MPFLRESAGYGWLCPPCGRKEQATGGCVPSLRMKHRLRMLMPSVRETCGLGALCPPCRRKEQVMGGHVPSLKESEGCGWLCFP